MDNAIQPIRRRSSLVAQSNGITPSILDIQIVPEEIVGIDGADPTLHRAYINGKYYHHHFQQIKAYKIAMARDVPQPSLTVCVIRNCAGIRGLSVGNGELTFH
jgi:pyruvate/2-oxoglutarate dehydrogenase complex dihydrolipoamide acyltransferase (E2) component